MNVHDVLADAAAEHPSTEPSQAAHEPNALDPGACPQCLPFTYAANHARHRGNWPDAMVALYAGQPAHAAVS